MTDNEIIKALECCTGSQAPSLFFQGCKDCPLREVDRCGYIIQEQALALINYQKECIEKLETIKSIALRTVSTQKAVIEMLNIEISAIRGAANSYKMHYLISMVSLKPCSIKSKAFSLGIRKKSRYENARRIEKRLRTCS